MNIELFPILGIEGIIVLSIILLVSLGLSGIRMPVQRYAGSITESHTEGKSSVLAGKQMGRGLRVRRRLVEDVIHQPDPSAENASKSTERAKIAAWIFSPVRRSAAQTVANQSKMIRQCRETERVKASPVFLPVEKRVEGKLTEDKRAGVLRNELRRMDSDTQWTRVNGIVNEGFDRAKGIESLHEAAGRQLDAVDYAYERMLLELGEVLPAVLETRTICRTNRQEAHAALEVSNADAALVKAESTSDGFRAAEAVKGDSAEPDAGKKVLDPVRRGKRSKERSTAAAAA